MKLRQNGKVAFVVDSEGDLCHLSIDLKKLHVVRKKVSNDHRFHLVGSSHFMEPRVGPIKQGGKASSFPVKNLWATIRSSVAIFIINPQLTQHILIYFSILSNDLLHR